jgi:ribosomal protein L29
MKLKEMRTKKEEELNDVLAVKREKLRELRFKDSNKQLKNIRDIRKTRQEIAQILTLLKEI